MIRARLGNSAAQLGTAHVEYSPHYGGLLFMEHGLAKVVGFPLQPNHKAYALFTLVPGLQGLLELVGGLLLALGLFTCAVAFILAGNTPISRRTRRGVSSHCSMAGSWQ
jgi:hypothetical protein